MLCLRSLPLGLLIVLLTQCAFAQFTAAIEGTVRDSSGSNVPLAEVTVTNQDLGVKRTAQTDSGSGLFRVGELAAGSYEVVISAPGFKKWSTKDLKVRTAETRSVFPVLEVGDVASAVTVTAESAAINVSTADVTDYVTQASMANQALPQNSVWQLSILVPGVTGSGETGGNGQFANNYGGEMGIRINAAGQRQDSNEIMFNGSYAEVPSRAGSFMVSPIPDSLEEFRIEAASFSAAKGRQGGAFLELITKSGSNDWHGTAGYIFTNNTLSARTIAQQSITDFSLNDSWVTIGGPIRKNKTFIFGSFDLLRSGSSITSVATVETPEFSKYVISNFPTSIAAKIFSTGPTAPPTTNIITVGQLKAQNPGLYDTTSTIPNSLPAEGTVSLTGTSPNDGEQYQVRVDHTFNDGKDRLFGLYYQSEARAMGVNLVRPAFSQPGPHENIWAKGDWTHVFSPTFVNTVNFRWSRASGNTGAPVGTGAINVPSIGITGTTGFGAWGPGGWYTPTWEWHELATLNRGKHSLKFGFEQALPNDSVPWQQTLTRPSFSFANLLDFAQDQPYSQSGPTVRVDSGKVQGAYLRYHTLYTGGFVQDDWRAKPWLTLNFGVRFDDYAHGITYTGDSDPGCYLFPGTGTSALAQIASGTAKCVKEPLKNRLGGFSPRFGFAWDVLHNGSLSIRGGYGLFHDRIPQNWLSTLNLLGPPFVATPGLSVLQGDKLTYGLGNYSDPNNLWPKPNVSYTLNAAGGVEGLRSNIMGVSPDLKIPQIHSWMLSIQKRLSSDLTAEINYVGSADHSLPVQTDVNRVAGDLADGVLNRLNPYFGQVTYGQTIGNSFANLVSAMLDKRFSRGWSVRGVYTYGKVLDNFSTTGLPISNIPTTNVIDAWNLRAQRGRADFDVRHRLSFDAMWAAPKVSGRWYASLVNDWRLGVIGLLQSGTPFTVYTTASFPVGDYNRDGYNYDLPNSPSFGNSLSGMSRSNYIKGIFTSSQFPVPLQGNEGSLGRNTFQQPGLLNTNLMAMRQFHVPWFTNDGAALQFRGDIFNVINRTNLDRVHDDLSDPLFGRVTNSIGPRSAQLGLRFRF
jgi:hypothetical protein